MAKRTDIEKQFIAEAKAVKTRIRANLTAATAQVRAALKDAKRASDETGIPIGINVAGLGTMSYEPKSIMKWAGLVTGLDEGEEASTDEVADAMNGLLCQDEGTGVLADLDLIASQRGWDIRDGWNSSGCSW